MLVYLHYKLMPVTIRHNSHSPLRYNMSIEMSLFQEENPVTINYNYPSPLRDNMSIEMSLFQEENPVTMNHNSHSPLRDNMSIEMSLLVSLRYYFQILDTVQSRFQSYFQFPSSNHSTRSRHKRRPRSSMLFGEHI